MLVLAYQAHAAPSGNFSDALAGAKHVELPWKALAPYAGEPIDEDEEPGEA
jgi:hypothetical protein